MTRNDAHAGDISATSSYRAKMRDARNARRRAYDAVAPERDRWARRHHYYHTELERFFRLQIPEGISVLEVGCGTGDLLAALRPSIGVGIDISGLMIERARRKHPHLSFVQADAEALPLKQTFDAVVLCNVIGDFIDVWSALRELRVVMRPDSRLVIAYYNFLWEPLIRAGERLGLKMPQLHQNWLSVAAIGNLLQLNGFEVIQQGYRILLPFGVPAVSTICNRLLAKLPLLKKLSLVNFVTARALAEPASAAGQPSCSVIIPTRNEAGNIEAAVERVPPLGSHTEIIFVDGDSTDGTVEKIEEQIERHRGAKDIKLIHQVPRGSRAGDDGRMLALGKGDAVRKGFDAATGDVLIILDGDLTVPPENLPMFVAALAEGRGELINGTRLVYPLERESMRLANMAGNKLFSLLFTWALEQPITDTLCGTKALLRRDYERIAANRGFFGDFDPFGDFDLLFGAAKLSLRIVDVPVRYQARTYGDVKIERWKHGLLLAKMWFLAVRKLKLS